MKPFFSGVLLTLIVLTGAAVVIIAGGYVKVSAAGSESSLLRWVLHTAYEKAVAEQAATVSVPPDLSSAAKMRQGADSFDSMCAGCHTPPGQASTAVHTGLNPQPPELRELMHRLSPAEAFWVIDNGVRMTGMPAFGESHDDEQLWALVAFIDTARTYSGDDYRAAVEAARSVPDSGGHGDHAHRHINEPPPAGDETGDSGKETHDHGATETEPAAAAEAETPAGSSGDETVPDDPADHPH